LVGCYRPASLECAITCANGASCPNGLTCGTDQLCHGGTRECSDIDASVADGGQPDAPDDSPALVFCDPSRPDLVACYEFEGNADDRSANHLNATTDMVGYQAGRVGSALALGKTSTVRIADTPVLDLQQFTVEAWLYQTDSTQGQNVTVVNNVMQYGLLLDTANQPFCACFTDTLIVASATTPLPLNRWTHVACTYDTTVLTLYVDGAVARQAPGNGPANVMAMSGTGIGSDSANTEDFHHYVGLIDELRIWLVPRTHAQICADAGPTACPLPGPSDAESVWRGRSSR
jgi:hypothetical protein